MNGEPPAPTSPVGPSSWRDVYTLVQDVEQRLTTRIEEGIATAREVGRDHETRIRVIEQQGSPEAREAMSMSTALALRTTALELVNTAGRERRMGQSSVITYGQKVVLAAVVFINVGIAIITFLKP